MSSYYGVIFSEFWTGTTGRHLRAAGKDAQLLALYLATNRHGNMIGLYRLHPDDVRHETGLGTKAIVRGFEATDQTAYATFDAASSYVWVRSMARIRLGLKPGDTLDPEDKRVVGANRIYQALDPNPFLGEFFDVNRRQLGLRKRREPSGLVVALSADHYMSPLPTPLEGASKPVTGSGIRIRIRNQEEKSSGAGAPRPRPPVENPLDNVGVITKLAHEAIDALGRDSVDLTEAVKRLCATRHIAYNSAVVASAIESARVQRGYRAS